MLALFTRSPNHFLQIRVQFFSYTIVFDTLLHETSVLTGYGKFDTRKLDRENSTHLNTFIKF